MFDTIKKLGLRGSLTRFVQGFLALDGVLHLAEVVSAYLEEAWTTLALTSIHATIFFIAAYFVGHDHTHHQHEEVPNWVDNKPGDYGHDN
jgi:hypothetical protein|tara:strand:+ start:698 stop:967 length:270 start_codon:yes stop_codon:yes gene_type:complete